MFSPAETTPVSLRATADILAITWQDGVTHNYRWVMLRDQCPCAFCKQKRAEPPQPAPLFPILQANETVPIKGTSVRPVGNYAYHIEFTDGHNSGIYSLEYLRELGNGQA